MAQFLQIGNYPPPMCGWAIQTMLVTEELRRRGHVCRVLNINENRKVKSPEFIDVQNGLDYVFKLMAFMLRGYRVHAHVNGESPKGYFLALIAVLLGRLFAKPAILTFHGGFPQTYFPRKELRVRWPFAFLFRMASQISCDSLEIERAIESYGVGRQRIASIPCFSSELLEFSPVTLPPQIETFLSTHFPVFSCYVSYRPEYRLPVLREAMLRFRQIYPDAGFVWVGFPAKEFLSARASLGEWSKDEAQSLLLLGNLPHAEFLSLQRRCSASIRTPACDGVSASVLEALALGIPVVASENGRRPPGVVTYFEHDAADLCAKLVFLMEHYESVKAQTRVETLRNNTKDMVDWLLDGPANTTTNRLVHVS